MKTNLNVIQLLLPIPVNTVNAVDARDVEIFNTKQKEGLACMVPVSLISYNHGDSFRPVAKYLFSCGVVFAVSKHSAIEAIIDTEEKYDSFLRKRNA